ncbi:MAG: YHS domain-containing (seleno)protein [Chitinophagaceae bacterium]
MKKISIALTSLVLFLSSTVAFSQQDQRVKQFNISKSSLAIDGYDPVGYFLYGKAIEGKKDISYAYQGVTYYFNTVENRKLFMAAPSKYEPQYGGWCAYAMGASGEKVTVDPKTFKIIDSKLYLFYNSFFNNTLKSWNKNESVLKTNADASWTKFYH